MIKEIIKINSRKSLDYAVEKIANLWIDNKYLRVRIDDCRSLSQNALKEVWYKDIADHYQDRTAKEVQRMCKFCYGVPILRRHAVHNWMFKNTIDRIPLYEQKLTAMDALSITSSMSTDEMNEYLTSMQQDYQFLKSTVATDRH